MARLRMVTRTVTVTTVEAMVVDVVTAEVKYMNFDLAGDFTTEEALKHLKKTKDSDTLKIVTINDLVVNDYMYGMLEEDFVKIAKILDPVTRKILADETTNEEVIEEITNEKSRLKNKKRKSKINL